MIAGGQSRVIRGARIVEVDCTLDVEQTAESFHVYAVPEGIEIQPGDRVQVHDAPARINFGDRFVRPLRATVIRAGWLERQWTRLTAILMLTELYEVGFQARAPYKAGLQSGERP